MQIELTPDERDLLLEALDVVSDQAIDTKRDLSASEKIGQDAFILKIADLAIKLKSAI